MIDTNNIVITKQNNKTIGLRFENGVSRELFVTTNKEFNVSDIVLGRVSSVKKDLNAAFIDLGGGIKGYLPLKEVPDSIKIVENASVPVQIVSDSQKNKFYGLTCFLSISGLYSVVVSDSDKISFSSKLNKDTVKSLYSKINENVSLNGLGLIVRTNAKEADFEDVKNEITENVDKLSNVYAHYNSRTVYSKLFSSDSEVIDRLKNIPVSLYDSIVTDDTEIFEDIIKVNEFKDKVSLYKDDKISLYALYGFDRELKEATERSVFLKSGGSISIDPVEACTVIDVNSAKCTTKADKDEMTHRINLEASVEIARQLMLRNISGIIIVDFINEADKDKKEELIEHLKNALKSDNCKAKFIEMTKLGLVEITRQKKYESIYEKTFDKA